MLKNSARTVHCASLLSHQYYCCVPVFSLCFSISKLILGSCLLHMASMFFRTECEIGFEATTQAKWVRLYFLSFHIVGVILVNNVVSAFIINSFMTQLAILRERDEAEVIDGEAVLYHEQAVFDGSMVTGTKTNLKGSFIARIRHTAQSEEGHYHDRLKRLFSRSSSTGEDKS